MPHKVACALMSELHCTYVVHIREFLPLPPGLVDHPFAIL